MLAEHLPQPGRPTGQTRRSGLDAGHGVGRGVRGIGLLVGVPASSRKCQVCGRRSATWSPSRPSAGRPEAGIRKVVGLLAPAMQAAAESLGFVRDAYDFPLAVHALDESLPVERIAPAHWYVSAND